MPAHYEHMKSIILEFFRSKGMEVAIEPHGSRGPDLEGIHGTEMVGEIKDAEEERRDLRSYWSSWNSPRQRFGGKTLQFQLKSVLPPDVENLPSAVKGWIAVVYGQMNYGRKRAALDSGWLVFEGHREYEPDLFTALGFLKIHDLIRYQPIEHRGDIGFVQIQYSSRV